LGIGEAAQQGGRDGTDRQCGHDQQGVAGDGGIQAPLGLVEAEAVLAKFEIFFTGHRSPPARISRAMLMRWPFG
jgi:hypothetical protein